MILEAVLQTGGRVTGLAVVSKEWQAMIEPRNFARIKLTAPRLAEFSSMVQRNRSSVHYIWLCLELQEYDCAKCAPHRVGGIGLSKADNTMLITALQDLFSTLSTWESNGNLLLDISVHSPSDAEHWFKYLTFKPDIPIPSDQHDLDLCTQQKQQSILASPNNHKHGWIAGKPISTPSTCAILKVFDELMGADAFPNGEQQNEWWGQLPLVPAVTGVLLRQQTRRRWKPTALAQMFARLPNLQEIHYEPWRQWYDVEQNWIDLYFRLLFESLTTSTNLQRLTLFENSNKQYALPFSRLLGDGCSLIRIPNAEVSRAVAKLSLQLEHLSASFTVDASYFLDACELSWKWPRLTSVALTSRLLTPSASPLKLDNMLQTAAGVALRMPKLRSMEIWNGREGLAMLFRYQLVGAEQPAVLTWRGTWEFALRSPVVEAWEAVALRQCGYGAIIVGELLDAGIAESQGDAIHHLKCLVPVIRPVSLQQIRMEHRIREGT
ncbi:uncharacterized protein BDW47DRAFT_115196 [Aspergillus candidus]|uniref:DUF6546 domain-containing protein n=1 Tax=Aspergillus candidus TaxID=41067 RepID=A0A2I2FN17_ASPCN|nr:hypothetical protein BDW47DRAFT_115196 [Aspergillus candidus]PLB42033.1 hypothetical protein BDW47DRAFT_115196 [Aspergillus candidus]